MKALKQIRILPAILFILSANCMAAAYTCPSPWVYVEADSQCHKVMPNYTLEEVREMIAQERQAQVKEAPKTASDNQAEGNEEALIGKLMKKVMFKKAKEEIERTEVKVNFGNVKYNGNVELGQEKVGIGSSNIDDVGTVME